MRKSIMMLIGLLSFAGIAHAQQEQPSAVQPADTVQSPDVPDPSAVDPDTPPVIRDGRDNDESTEAADDAAERQHEQQDQHQKH
ncbi:hypothetical protein K5Q02_14670 [Pseudomonas sp. MM211]|uniref:hypothetical protein n=1 Tax=Pseudomonas sp. MM211 TaxID=2866808 RepID=UPI001CEC2D9A|nr:hypothetical protein [Pseudomonas sp. MM211]UCJ15108.1 hypothetical protein K5Q02_14670 [Pseudomonas sp. MM211]